jgi:general secretion pathway protein G
VHMGRFPTTSEGLKVLVSSDGLEDGADKWQGSYIDSVDMMVDTYGTPIEYENTGSGFVLRSLGADGQRGGSGSSADIELRN